MPTSSFVESGFWCFDALFVPQQHPARELQDTFYLSGMAVFLTVTLYLMIITDPKYSLPPNPEYYELVSKVHEHGGYGSIGYRAPWSDEESRKLLLRTHTTASSAHMLYKLAARCRGEDFSEQFTLSSYLAPDQKADGFRPAKLFSIDRVFRNETMDATHLAEFHQVEGVVADRNLTLADLIGNMLHGLQPVYSFFSRFYASFFRENGDQASTLQASIQSLYRGARERMPENSDSNRHRSAVIGDLCLSFIVE